MHLSDKGLFNSANALVPCSSEAEIFEALSLRYQEPQDRSLCPLVPWRQRRTLNRQAHAGIGGASSGTTDGSGSTAGSDGSSAVGSQSLGAGFSLPRSVTGVPVNDVGSDDDDVEEYQPHARGPSSRDPDSDNFVVSLLDSPDTSDYDTE